MKEKSRGDQKGEEVEGWNERKRRGGSEEDEEEAAVAKGIKPIRLSLFSYTCTGWAG